MTTSTDHPRETDGALERLTQPNTDNCNDAANATRMLACFAHKLVVVLPDAQEGAKTPADVYCITPKGMLSDAEAAALVLPLARRYWQDCFDLSDDMERKACIAHAQKLKDKGAYERIQALMRSVVIDLKNGKQLPEALVVKTRADIDADLGVIGTPEGVVCLHTGVTLNPEEARKRFVFSNTGVNYVPSAQHNKVDEILPPVSELEPESMEWFRARILAYALTHGPAREFLWEVCLEGSGKSTFVNTLQAGLGLNYINTIPAASFRLDRNRGPSSHNGPLLWLQPPVRISFVMEFRGRLESDIIKPISGGDQIDVRQISQKWEKVKVSSHVWFLGNDEDEDEEGAGSAPQLGIGQDDSNSRAIQERAKLLKRSRIQNPDKAVVNLKTQEFREAALARLIEYTMEWWDKEFPESIPSAVELLEAQKDAEKPEWKREWLPTVVPTIIRPGPLGVPLEVGGPPAEQACTKGVYDHFKSWWQENGDGPIPSSTVVGIALSKHLNAKKENFSCKHHGKGCRRIVGYVDNQTLMSLFPIDAWV